ncbi:MAG: class I SAM-dependent methyltransferase [Candidatus Nanopelagicales bacterium]|jgi:ubiquinone/menaquinone biosynthesis C-methylase UbiE|nr:class I SAM-dependent methyltransferase [Candidatus Nanopelagicales bacterium]
MAAHDHPLFTRVYAMVSGLGEHSELGPARSHVLAGATGRLLIVGLGPGHDLDHLPPAVTSVVAVEPSPSMRAAAHGRVEAARSRGIEVELIDAVGEALPLPDDSVDSVLFAYVLCSVDSVTDVLAEARRVLHPGGTVCVLEHVRAAPGSWTGRMQRAVSTGGLWSRLAGGCRCDQDTRRALADAGLHVEDLEERRLVNVPVVNWTLMGSSRP